MTDAASTPFHDLDAYVALRRLGSIALSADGSRLVAAAQELNAEKTAWVSALWEVDVTGGTPARRLTRSAKGESAPAFAPDGALWFTSGRPDPVPGDDAHADADDAEAALWRLPATTGEAARVGTRAGGIDSVRIARRAGTVVVTSDVLPGSGDNAADKARRKARKDAKVSAILHDGGPVRYWDHDLGPGQQRIFTASAPTAADLDDDPSSALTLTDLTPDPGRALDETALDVSGDGSFVVAQWTVREKTSDQRSDLVVLDVETGARRVLASDLGSNHESPAISPDQQTVVCLRERRSSAEEPVDTTLWAVPIDGGPGRDLTADLDLWPGEPAWSPDGRTIYFVADEQGHAPVFALDVESGSVRRLTDAGAFSHLQVCPSGAYVYAVRSSYTDSGTIVRIATGPARTTSPAGAGGTTGEDAVAGLLELAGPAPVPVLPGTLAEIRTTADDGTPIRAWLALPHGAAAIGEGVPAPLVLWIHGGPLGSWNAWSWRWNPWLLVAQGYAVLLPDPALSTGYGMSMIQRGWGSWGDAPYTDLMTMTDAAIERSDIDGSRIAAMGGSFGGYMANWVAGHTDRFAAIVTHASLFSLDQFGATTDLPAYWKREMTPERAAANSPDRYGDRITTPMLVVHGDRDYRVPVGEGLRLWWKLLEGFDGEPSDLPHRFLYFPDENHWVLTPGHAKLWYETVIAFVAWHVLGREWSAPELL